MELVRVNSEELENYPIENFIDKFVYTHYKPGTGKTKKINKIFGFLMVQLGENVSFSKSFKTFLYFGY